MIKRIRYSLLLSGNRQSLFLGGAATIAVIGALTGSVLRLPWSVLYSRLPYSEPHRLVNLWQQPRAASVPVRGLVAPAVLLNVVARQQIFSDLAAAEVWDGNTSAWVDLLDIRTRRLRGALVTPNFFRVLGVRMVQGQGLEGLEEGEGNRAILSYDVWQREFNGDRAVVGRSVRLASGRNRVPGDFVIVGVLPRIVAFTYPIGTDIYLPVDWEDIRRLPEDAVTYEVIGRLAPGASVADALHHLQALVDSSPTDLSWFAREETIRVEPMIDHVVGSSRWPLLLVGAVGIALLLVGALNTAAALMVLTDAGRPNRLIQLALGASRWRLVRQSLIQVTTLVMVGTLVGIVGTLPLLSGLRTLLLGTLPRAGQLVGLDWPLIVAITAALGVACIVGSLSAVRSSPTALRTSLSATTDPGDVPRTRRRQRALIALEMSVLYVLLVFASVTILTVQRLNAIPLGFAPGNTYVSEVRLLGPKYRGDRSTAKGEFRRRVLQRIRQVPGVIAATTASTLPLRGVDWLWIVSDPVSSRRMAVNARQVDTAFFQTLGIQVRDGRTFTDADMGGEKVAVISESLAATLGGGQRVVGRRLVGREEYTIIGVVVDVRFGNPTDAGGQALYLPVEQSESETVCFALQSGLPRERLELIVRGAVAAADSEQPVDSPVPLEALVRRMSAEQEVVMLIAVTFAATAAVLAVVAVHGAVVRRLIERRRELGLRLILGSSHARLQWLTIRSELTAPLCGVVLGVGAWLALLPIAMSVFVDVNPASPLVLAVVAIVLIGMCLGIVWIRAHHVGRIDLASTIRN